MGDAIQGRFNIQRTEQPRRVVQEQRAAQKLFTFSNVAKAPDASDNLISNLLWSGIAFIHTSVFEMLCVKTFTFRMVIELACTGQKLFRIVELVPNVIQQ